MDERKCQFTESATLHFMQCGRERPKREKCSFSYRNKVILEISRGSRMMAEHLYEVRCYGRMQCRLIEGFSRFI
jgi:hypothetical protein